MWTPMRRGYTPAGRWVVRFATGDSAFVKVGTTPDTSAWLRAEYGVYSRICGDFLPTMLGWEDGEAPVLVLEDLSRAAWPPPWSPVRVEQVRAALAAIAATPPPPDTPPIAVRHSELRSWRVVAADPAPFLSLGLCSAAWLDAALPILVAADAGAALDGESLLHLDVRSDNICFVGARAVLVDWNLACRGNALVDVAAWLPSLAAEGGPPPTAILPDAPELAALMAGFFAARAGLPHPPGALRVRGVQLTQLQQALPWAVASLGLPPPV
ncbi:MAG: phosphotransferase [Thermomicrobiales bacterium]